MRLAYPKTDLLHVLIRVQNVLDTLFIGDVGRPDLAVKSDLTQEDLAGLLYESLKIKF
jgi:hypothetical protein